MTTKIRRWIWCALAVGWAAFGAPAQEPSPSPGDFPAQLIAELNRVRTQPGAYADWLAARRSAYQSDKTLALPGQPLLQTEEGVNALDDAIDALRTRSEPLPPVTTDSGLIAAAKDFADDQARTGGMGHTASDGRSLSERLVRYGQPTGEIGENLAYGPMAVTEIIFSWVVDDGVADRGHRRNLLNPRFHAAGAAVARHPRWGSVCVMEFAQGFEKKPGTAEPAAAAVIQP